MSRVNIKRVEVRMYGGRNDIHAIPVHDGDEPENQLHQPNQSLYQAENGH